MGRIRTQKAMLGLLRYVEDYVPDVRLGGESYDPVLWIPAPDGYAVWIAFTRLTYVACISRRQPPEVRHVEVGNGRATPAEVWRAAGAWFNADPELRQARSVNRNPGVSSEPGQQASPPNTSTASRSARPAATTPSREFMWSVAAVLSTILAEASDPLPFELETHGTAISVLIRTGEHIVFFVQDHSIMFVTATNDKDGMNYSPYGEIDFAVVDEPVSTCVAIADAVIRRLDEVASTEGIPLRVRAMAEDEAALARVVASDILLSIEETARQRGASPVLRAAARSLGSVRQSLLLTD
jgi:hypothetical protein